jgi:hypothetical protein
MARVISAAAFSSDGEHLAGEALPLRRGTDIHRVAVAVAAERREPQLVDELQERLLVR